MDEWREVQMRYMRTQSERGAALLDERIPDWAGRVAQEMLEMASLHDCVLGQLYGHYDRGIQTLGIPYEQSSDYGFTCSGSFAKLNETWMGLIDDRIGTPS